MNNKINLRKARLEDLNLIMKMVRKAIEVMAEAGIFQWDDLYPDEELLHKDILNNEMFLCEIDNQMACIFVLNQECDDEYAAGDWQYKDSSYSVIHRLCVNTVFQGRGIGSMTIQLIEEYLRNRGIECVRLDAFSGNPIALRMYEKLGYRRSGELFLRKGLFYLYEKKL
ncbi:MAG: acetyltransferase [Eubacterium sp.]|nr:acetyltransferase [Eubacterium sp.]